MRPITRRTGGGSARAGRSCTTSCRAARTDPGADSRRPLTTVFPRRPLPVSSEGEPAPAGGTLPETDRLPPRGGGQSRYGPGTRPAALPAGAGWPRRPNAFPRCCSSRFHGAFAARCQPTRGFYGVELTRALALSFGRRRLRFLRNFLRRPGARRGRCGTAAASVSAGRGSAEHVDRKCLCGPRRGGGDACGTQVPGNTSLTPPPLPAAAVATQPTDTQSFPPPPPPPPPQPARLDKDRGGLQRAQIASCPPSAAGALSV